MSHLLTALWEPKVSIISTIVLLLLLVYCLVIISYRPFWEYYPDNVCYSLWNCFWISFDQTLKEGGLGKYLDPAYSEEEGRAVNLGRIIYDNVEYFLISLLLIAIISGIIIDKFTELRERREEIQRDQKSSCFICGKLRKELDKDQDTTNFDMHVKLEHNLWHYVYFIAYLDFQESKRVPNMTAIEKYVLDKINNRDNRWFPCYDVEGPEDSTLIPVLKKI